MARGRAKGNVRVVGIGESVVPAGGTANVAVMGVTTVVPAPPDGMAAGAVASHGAIAAPGTGIGGNISGPRVTLVRSMAKGASTLMLGKARSVACLGKASACTCSCTGAFGITCNASARCQDATRSATQPPSTAPSATSGSPCRGDAMGRVNAQSQTKGGRCARYDPT